LEDRSIKRHDDWNSEHNFEFLKTTKEKLEQSLLRRLILCSLLFTKKPKQGCRIYFTKNDVEKTWKSLLTMPLLEAQDALDITVHGNLISNNTKFKTIFPPFTQAKGTGPGEFYSLLLQKQPEADGSLESWVNHDEVLCISSGCYAIYQNERSWQHYDPCVSRGNEQEVDNIIKKCPKEFTNSTTTLNVFHVLLIGPKLNFLSMLYSKECILPMYDFGLMRRKMKNSNPKHLPIRTQQQNSREEFERQEMELERLRKDLESDQNELVRQRMELESKRQEMELEHKKNRKGIGKTKNRIGQTRK